MSLKSGLFITLFQCMCNNELFDTRALSLTITFTHEIMLSIPVELPQQKNNNVLKGHARTKAQTRFAVTAKLISTIVSNTQIVQLLLLNLKSQVSSLFLRLYRLLCVGPGQKPRCWFKKKTELTSRSHSD